MGYSPWGHKESDMTERLHMQSAKTVGYSDGSAIFLHIRNIWGL